MAIRLERHNSSESITAELKTLIQFLFSILSLFLSILLSLNQDF
jgi:hypothetical protein